MRHSRPSHQEPTESGVTALTLADYQSRDPNNALWLADYPSSYERGKLNQEECNIMGREWGECQEQYEIELQEQYGVTETPRKTGNHQTEDFRTDNQRWWEFRVKNRIGKHFRNVGWAMNIILCWTAVVFVRWLDNSKFFFNSYEEENPKIRMK